MAPENLLADWIMARVAALKAACGRVFRVERGVYGNIIVRFGARSYFQRSGHGAICDLRLGRLVMWSDPRTGKPFHVRFAP